MLARRIKASYRSIEMDSGGHERIHGGSQRCGKGYAVAKTPKARARKARALRVLQHCFAGWSRPESGSGLTLACSRVGSRSEFLHHLKELWRLTHEKAVRREAIESSHGRALGRAGTNDRDRR